MPSMTLGGFIGHLTGAMMAMEAEKHHALERAAKLIEDRAKEDIGSYQTGISPFADWAELADSTQDDRARQGYPPNDPELRDGTLRDSYSHMVDAHAGGEAAIGSNYDVAVWQELGTSRMPPRAILGAAAVQEAPQVAKILGHGVVKALIGKDVAGGSMDIP